MTPVKPRPQPGESGYAMMTVMVFALIIIIAGMAFFAMATYETKGALYRQESSEAFYLAEAAIERAPIVDRPISLLAVSIIPVMLVTLGIQLQRMGLPKVTGDVIRSLVAKLLIQPAVAALAVAALGLSGVPAGAVILQAAMPAGPGYRGT